MNDFDGCRRVCGNRQDHTMVPGECEKAPMPEPTVSMSAIAVEPSGETCIVFDTYDLEGLADLIEPALRNVKIRLGPNSLAAIRHGNTLTLTSGELRAMALEAAHAIIHRNEK